MYYVETETDDYVITTSYATKGQAKLYDKPLVFVGEKHLYANDEGQFIEAAQPDDFDEWDDLGRVRTVYKSKRDGSNPGRYMIYYYDCDENGKESWTWSGIAFDEYGKANQFLKMKSLVFYGDMAVVENPNVSQAFAPQGLPNSIDLSNQELTVKTNGIYDD